MKKLFLPLLIALVSLTTTSLAQISIGNSIANKLAEQEKATLCYNYNAGLGDQPCKSSCKISGRKYSGSFACENNPDKAKRERALKCPSYGIENSSRCYCECADDVAFKYKMLCAPAGGGSVGANIAACAGACQKQGLTFNKAGLAAPQASIELISTSKFNVQGAPNCEKELNVPAALMCFCDKN